MAITTLAAYIILDAIISSSDIEYNGCTSTFAFTA